MKKSYFKYVTQADYQFRNDNNFKKSIDDIVRKHIEHGKFMLNIQEDQTDYKKMENNDRTRKHR